MTAPEMQTLLLDGLAQPEAAAAQAGKLLAAGGLVALPTETVYGLGADAFNDAAVRRVFEVKGRPADNPVITHIDSLEMLPKLSPCRDERLFALAAAFWPGPLTIILPKVDTLPDVTTGGRADVGVRMPSHPLARAIIRAAGTPIAAPSANLSGRPSPTTARHCVDDLWGRVEAIVEGGECQVGIESTVLALFPKPTVLRPGAITAEMISEALGETVTVDPAATHPYTGAATPSPGMKYRHYAPKAPLTLIKSDLPAFVAYVTAQPKDGLWALVFTGEEPALGDVPALGYGKSGDALDQAHHLFDALRRLDALGAKRILARCPEERGNALGVYNRILRAAAFEEVTL